MANVAVWTLLAFLCVHRFSAGAEDNVTHLDLKVIFARKEIDFVWSSRRARQKAIKEKSYIPINTSISGLKVWQNWLFLTVPRWKDGVPLTLTYINSNNLNKGLLAAFPNWKMQEIGNCKALQFVQEIEIDPSGKMWIIDSGRMVPIAGGPSKGVVCPPKLVVVDLNSYKFNSWSSEKDIKVSETFEFPKDVADPSTCYFDDLVLDLVNNFVYIVDFGSKPGLVVYDIDKKKSWRIEDESMKPTLTFPPLTLNGATVPLNTRGLNGIALSPVAGNRTLYYTPLSNRAIYSVPTSALTPGADISDVVSKLGEKNSINDGLMIDNTGNIFFGLIEENAVGSWNINDKNNTMLYYGQNNTTLQWIDAIAIHSGYLYLVTNRLPNVLLNKVNPKEVNYRIVRAKIGTDSYLYPYDKK